MKECKWRTAREGDRDSERKKRKQKKEKKTSQVMPDTDSFPTTGVDLSGEKRCTCILTKHPAEQCIRKAVKLRPKHHKRRQVIRRDVTPADHFVTVHLKQWGTRSEGGDRRRPLTSTAKVTNPSSKNVKEPDGATVLRTSREFVFPLTGHSFDVQISHLFVAFFSVF